MPLPDCSFVAHADVAERTQACRSPRRLASCRQGWERSPGGRLPQFRAL